MKTTLLICLLILTGCATPAIGPISGKQYKYDYLGFMKDPQGYFAEVKQDRRNKYIETHPETRFSIRNDILAGRLAIGMTHEETKASIGVPSHINRSVFMNHIHEQWVYTSMYVYFHDGLLSGWQD